MFSKQSQSDDPVSLAAARRKRHSCWQALIDLELEVEDDYAPIFTCGGSVAIQQPPSTEPDESGGSTTRPQLNIQGGEPSTRRVSKPVTIRWSLPNETGRSEQISVGRVTMPLQQNSATMIEPLMRESRPECYSRGPEGVIDGRYRNVMQMSTSKFFTDFEPHLLGIADTITQILFSRVEAEGSHRYIVEAKLRNLNVRSLPIHEILPMALLTHSTGVPCPICQIQALN